MQRKNQTLVLISLLIIVIFGIGLFWASTNILRSKKPTLESRASSYNSRLTLVTNSINVTKDKDFEVKIVLDSAGAQVAGVDVVLTYNPSQLQTTTIQQDATNTSLQTFLPLNSAGMFDRQKVVSNANSSGKLTFSLLAADNAQKKTLPTFNGTTTLARVFFKPLIVGSSSISFVYNPGDTKDSNITIAKSYPLDVLNGVTGLSLQINPAPSPTTPPTPLPSKTPTPSIKPTPTVISASPSKAQAIPTVVPESGSSVTVSVSSTMDDVNEENGAFDQAYHPAHKNLWIGTGAYPASSYTGIRFASVQIPKGAIVQSAKLRVFAPVGAWINAGANVYGEAVGLSQTFSNLNLPSARVKTTNHVSTDISGQWVQNTWYEIGEMKNIVQEIINRSDWKSGNSITLILKGSSSSQFARKFVRSYDGDPALAPQLVITYK